MSYNITSELLKELAQSINFESLQKDKLPATFHFNNKNFIPVGSMSSHETGYIHVQAHEVIPLENYKSKLKPLFETAHFCEVMNRKREVGYHARLLKHQNKLFVMIDPIIYFYPIQQPKQLEIF